MGVVAGHQQQQEAVVAGHQQREEAGHQEVEVAIFQGKYQVCVLAFGGCCPLSPRTSGWDHAKGT